MIYFFEIQETRNIKIGYAKRCIKHRFFYWYKKLGKLKVLGCMDGDLTKELEIHCRFSKLSVSRSHGSVEIFSPHKSLLTFILGNTFQNSETAMLNSGDIDFSDTLTIDEFIKYVQISKSTLYKYLPKRTFKYTMKGKKYFVDIDTSNEIKRNRINELIEKKKRYEEENHTAQVEFYSSFINRLKSTQLPERLKKSRQHATKTYRGDNWKR